MAHQSDLISADILAYLKQHEHKDLLRFITCGSVDDGKSTLIGRLLHDSKMIYEDQLAAVVSDSAKVGNAGEAVDLALLVDGLQSEREQGITIDVAYRYFSTDKRKFIIADTPGHEQYTRNMATGASTANLAIILIDARYGVQTQTRRHSYLVSLLGIRHVVVAINKMDLVDYDPAVFERIVAEYRAFSTGLGLSDVHFVPLSALVGDNVVHPSEQMPWYDGLPLLSLLENVTIDHDQACQAFRLPVQYVNRPHLDFRGYCGTIAAGEVCVGEAVMALPSRRQSTVKAIYAAQGEVDVARAGQAVTLVLADELDISRGDCLVTPKDLPHVTQNFGAMVVWMQDAPLRVGQRYWLKAGTQLTSARLLALDYQVDINTLKTHACAELGLNGIAHAQWVTEVPIVCERYADSRALGSFIVIDRLNNATAGAGMLDTVQAISQSEENHFSAFELELNALICKHFPHWGAQNLQTLLAKKNP